MAPRSLFLSLRPKLVALALCSLILGLVPGEKGGRCDVTTEKQESSSAFSPSLMVGSRDGLLPADAYLRLGTPRLRHGAIWSIAWSPDGKWIASTSGGYDDSLRIWDAFSGNEVRRFQATTGVLHVAISPDGTLAATVQKPGELYLRKLDDPKVVKNRSISEHAVVVFAADGKSMMTIDEEGQVCLMTTASLQIKRTFGDARAPKAAACVHDMVTRRQNTGDWR